MTKVNLTIFKPKIYICKGGLRMINSINLINSMQELALFEVGIAVFYMRYVAFGFTFSSNMDELLRVMDEIERVQQDWGFLHSN